MLKSLLGAVIGAALLVTGLAPLPIFGLGSGSASAQTMFRPVAVVNDSAITGFDLEQRARILASLGFGKADPQRIRREALDRLIEDRLKVQEGARIGITASDEQLSDAFGRIAKSSGVTVEELLGGMRKQGVTSQALRDMVGADVIWQQVIRTRFRRRIDPGEADIDAEIALMSESDASSYKIAEIGLPARDGGRTEAETRQLANEIYAALSAGGDFGAAVKRYSRSPSAKNGGVVGWVPGTRLPPDFAAALSVLEPGQVTEPLPVSGGLSILRLLETRVDAAAVPDANDTELRDQMSRKLQNERAQRLAEGLLQELRRDALIELR